MNVKAKARRLLDTARPIMKEVASDDLGGAAAEMAYRTLLAMFPFFIFLAALGGFVASALAIDNPTDRIMDSLAESLPSDASSVLRGQLEAVLESKNAGLLSLGIIGAIWSASAAIGTLMKALNRVYDVEETRPFVKRTALQVGLTALVGLFFTAAFALIIVGQLFAKQIGAEIGVEGVAVTLLNIARLPFVIVLLTAGVAFLYWAAPNVNIPFRWVSPGSVIFIVSWVAFSLAFGFYVSNFGSYNSTYGTLGGVVVLLTYLYISSYILLVGAEVNAFLQAKVEPESQDVPAGAAEGGRVSAERADAGPDGQPEPSPPPRERTSPVGGLVIFGAFIGLALGLWRALRGNGRHKRGGGHPAAA